MNQFSRRIVLGFALALPAVSGGNTLLAQDAAVESQGVLAVSATPSGPEAELRDALLAGGPELASVLDVYAQHEFAPIWNDAKFDDLIAAIEDAPRHALPATRYGLDRLRALRGAPGAEIAREVEASRSFLRYARDINSGIIEPRSADSDIVISPRRPDPHALLEGLAGAPDARDYLAALAPSHPDYVRLLDEKARLEPLVASGGWGETVPAGPTLRLGDEGPRVLALRARLARMEGRVPSDSPVFDVDLEASLRAFQLRHGLNDDGVAGPKTLEALNSSAEMRLRQVVVNLERQRWLNFERGARHIYVNQADFSVRVIDHGKTSLFSRVVVGQVRHKTQEFNDEMTHLVVNPTWHVPYSIASEEMLPKLKSDPGALGGTMQVMTRNGTRINPELVDFTQFSQSNFPFIIKQRPGPSNALGRVKFMFPNQFNIYLHDTPAKNLFARDVRAYSHGCVRVQKPFELAHVLLGAQMDNAEDYFQQLLNAGVERQVNLKKPVPVYLTYQSAWIDDAGVPQYRADVYGRDTRVFDALVASGVRLGTVEG